MYKFKVSKYKNVSTQISKKNLGLSIDTSINNVQNHCNLVETSACLLAFHCEGGNIGIYDCDLQYEKPVLLKAHGDDINDFGFSPFDDGLLASCSKNGQIQIWQIKQVSPEITPPNNPFHSASFQQPIEALQFHPIVSSLLTFSIDNQIHLWDLIKSKSIYESPKCSQIIQSFDWKYEGDLLAITNQNGEIHVWDPRIDKQSSFGLTLSGHENHRDSRVIWLGNNKSYLISTGFNKRKAKEAFLWDTRATQKPVGVMSEFESSTGIWIPLFDYDTNMLFLAGRNDSTIYHWDINDVINRPSNFDNNIANKQMIDTQIKGAALANKRSLKVMETEVNRINLLTNDYIASISYKIPRKSYRDFHSDLYPETKSPELTCLLEDWQGFNEGIIQTISLNPGVNKKENLVKLNVKIGEKIMITSDKEVDQFFEICKEDGIDVRASIKNIVQHEHDQPQQIASMKTQPKDNEKEIQKPQTPRRGFKIRTTKFRHLKGTILPKETQVTNFFGLCKTIPGECDIFKANKKFAAVPIGQNCNNLAVINIVKGHRLDGGIIPHLVCGNSICDFAFDPFDDNRIVIGCDDGTIQLWNIPNDGLLINRDKYENKLTRHKDRITLVKFHPIAKDVLASFSMDLMIIIWDLNVLQAKICLNLHSEPLFSMSWSPNGEYLATFSKDQKIQIINPRTEQVIKEGQGPQGTRGGRICWAQKGTLLIVTGFSRASERQILIYNSFDLSNVIASEGLDVSPAILIPFYDEDSCTLFCTGKGDSTIYCFEISSLEDGHPYIHSLSHFNTPTPHQAVDYLFKNACDVRQVEFARGYRLTTSSIEPISFTVPRLRNQFFQDDLFPSTKVLWTPTLTSEEWFSSANKEPIYYDLKPKDMTLLSDAPPPVQAKRINKEIDVQLQFEGDSPLKSSLAVLRGGREKQEMLVQKMSEKVDFNDDELPQERYEGVDPDEWKND